MIYYYFKKRFNVFNRNFPSHETKNIYSSCYISSVRMQFLTVLNRNVRVNLIMNQIAKRKMYKSSVSNKIGLAKIQIPLSWVINLNYSADDEATAIQFFFFPRLKGIRKLCHLRGYLFATSNEYRQFLINRMRRRCFFFSFLFFS